MSDVLDAIADFAVRLMELLGGPGAGLAVALENLFPPIPSEVVLPLAGFTASQGSFTLPSVIAWTTAGSVGGALVLYALGAWLGQARLRAIVERLPLVDVQDLDRAESWFLDHGRTAVLVGRVIPIVRSLISVPAGVERMPVVVFVGLTALGSLVWNSTLIGAGYLLGEQWSLVERYAGVLSRSVLVVGVVAVVAFVVIRVFRGRRAAK